MATRNKKKAEEAIAELNERTGRLAIYLELDLSSLSSVKRAAEEFMSRSIDSKEKKLHILFNNAGVMWSPREMLTAEGYDMQFGTNVLGRLLTASSHACPAFEGHFYLTALLMPALLAGRDSSPDGYVRVITTSSSAAYRYTLNWDSFKAGAARRKMSPRTLYCQSKFADVVFARQLAKRYGEKGIVSISCNPGQHVVTQNLIAHPASKGALTQLWAGTMPETVQYNGEFLIPWARVGRCRREAYDNALGERLWAWLEEQVEGRRG
ncbi:predicted protein [Postia placenta Mad-698-R]|nr:predicted protein [Postia placenta Mad-698-R]